MGLFDKLFGRKASEPADERKLAAPSEVALSKAIQTLPAGGRGWITLAEAARLFSAQEEQYAFGEIDETGKLRLEKFSAEQRCSPDFMPTEGRLYFTRN